MKLLLYLKILFMGKQNTCEKRNSSVFPQGTRILIIYWKTELYLCQKKTIKVEPGCGNEPHLYLLCLLTGITTLSDCCNDSLRLILASLQCAFVKIYFL